MIFEKSQKSADQDQGCPEKEVVLFLKVLFLKKHVTFFCCCYPENEEITLLHEFIFVFT